MTRQTDKIKELVAHLMKHSRYILKARNEKIEVEEELNLKAGPGGLLDGTTENEEEQDHEMQ